MDLVIDCYFDKLFQDMERDYLTSRYKRRLLVKYFSDMINSAAEAENLDKIDICERIVLSALRYHNISMSDNGSVCLLGKFHNVLYVAAKLCYDWNLTNNTIVTKILNDIFHCEGTFERIFVGAIFGIRVTHFLSGWKCDFEDREENISALIYFLDHAIIAKLQYNIASSLKTRFIDVPMESCGQVLPLRIAIQQGVPDILLIMLRYGASTECDKLTPSPLEILLMRISEFDIDSTSIEPIIPENLLICLKMILRTIPIAYVKNPEHITDDQHVRLCKQYKSIIDRNLVPPERSGLVPPELGHLCRCRIRQCLFDNWALPHGIRTLEIPDFLRDYIDLLYD